MSLGVCRCTDGVGVERYLQQLQKAKIRGYLFEQQNYIPEK